MRGEQLREEMESGVAFEETNNMGAEDARSVFTQHAPVSERTAAWLDGRRRRGWMDERKVAVGMVDAERRSVGSRGSARGSRSDVESGTGGTSAESYPRWMMPSRVQPRCN